LSMSQSFRFVDALAERFGGQRPHDAISTCSDFP
jgi:hypothetical protein